MIVKISKGQGIRFGLCPITCSRLFSACSEDFFKYIDSNQITFCEKNSIICSKASDIFTDYSQFCNALGFGMNYNENFNELIENIISNETFSPVCYNGKPSVNLWGASQRIIENSALQLNIVIYIFTFIYINLCLL